MADFIRFPFLLQQAELGDLVPAERVGGAQQHKRMVTSLQKQIQQQNSKLDEVIYDNQLK